MNDNISLKQVEISKFRNFQRRKVDVTIQEVRALPGYEKRSDLEIGRIIEDIKEFALLLNISTEK